MAALHRQQHFVEEHCTGGGAVAQIDLHQPLRLAQKHLEVVVLPTRLQQTNLLLRDQVRLQQRLRMVLRRGQRGLLVALVDAPWGMPHRSFGRQERIALIERHPLEVEVVGVCLDIRLVFRMVELHLDQRIVRDKPELGVDRGLQAIQRDATEIGIRLNAVGILPEIVLFRVVDRIGECVLPVDTDAFHESTVQQPHRVVVRSAVRSDDIHCGSRTCRTELPHGEGCSGVGVRRRPEECSLVRNTRNLNEAGPGPRSGHTDLCTGQHPVESLLDPRGLVIRPCAEPCRVEQRLPQLLFDVDRGSGRTVRGTRAERLRHIRRALRQRLQVVDEVPVERVKERQVQLRLATLLHLWDARGPYIGERSRRLAGDEECHHRSSDIDPIPLRQLQRVQLRIGDQPRRNQQRIRTGPVRTHG